MYTVINNSEIVIYQGLPYSQSLKVLSSKDPPIDEVRILFRNRNIQLTHDEEKDSWKLKFTSEETAKLELGASFYNLEIHYQDKTKEEKDYIGRLIVKKVKPLEVST